MIFENVEQVFERYPECLVHPVSCTGVAHDILSKQIKKSYPDYFREYSRFCIRKKLNPGQAHFYQLGTLFGTKFIVTLTIKNNWQEKVQPQVFKNAFDEFKSKCEELKVTTVAFPQIDGVPSNWLRGQFEKISAEKNGSLSNVLFFN